MIIVLLLCTFITFSCQNQVNRYAVTLSTEEEECIHKTQIDRNVVIADKISTQSLSHRTHERTKDPTLNTYLGCYADKLSATGKIHFTKNIFVKIPGYKTTYEIKSLWCNENYYSETSGRPCVQRI